MNAAGKVKQKWKARAGTKFTKTGAHLLAELCSVRLPPRTRICSQSPASAGAEDLWLEAVPDPDVPDVDLEVCAIRVHRVGSGLPCIYHSNPNSRETHANSDSARQFYDAGSLEIGATCPVNYPNGDGKANQFTASMYWRRPQKQDTPTSTELFLGGGMSVETKYVWPLAEKYEVAGTLETETKGILAFRDDVVDPGKILTKCQSEAQDRSV